MSYTESQYWVDRLNIDSNNAALLQQEKIANEIMEQEYKLVSMLRPTVSIDGNQYCVLYGPNLQEGVAGFGDSAYLAVFDFNKNWERKLSTRRDEG